MYKFAKVASVLLAGSLMASNAAFVNAATIPLSDEMYNTIVQQALLNSSTGSLLETTNWLDIDSLISQGQTIRDEKEQNAANYTVWAHSESDFAWLMEVKTLFMQYRGCSVYNDALSLINTMYTSRMQFTYEHVDDLLEYLDTLKTEMPGLVDNNNIVTGARNDVNVISSLLSTGRTFVENDSGYNTSAYNKWLNDVDAFNSRYMNSSVYLSLNNVLATLKTTSTVNRNAQSTNQILGALDELAVQIDLTTTYVNRAVEKPVPETTVFYYSGTPQTVISNGDRYSVTGGVAQDVGEYTATLTLSNDSVWTDWTNDPYTINWSIERCPITNKGDFVMENIPSDATALGVTGAFENIIVRDLRTNRVLTYGVDYTIGLSVADNADYPSVLTVYGLGNYTTPADEVDRLSIDVSFDEPVITFRWMTTDGIDPEADFGWTLPQPTNSRTFNGYMTDIPTYSTFTSGDKVYVFYGWAPVDGGNDFVTRNTRFTQDTVLYGIFEEVVPGREVQIFHSNGGTEVGERYFYDGTTTDAMPENPTRVGYTFGGWYQDADCRTPYMDTTAYCANLYAKWNPVEYTLTAYYDGVSDTYTIAYGSYITPPSIGQTSVPVIFEGWYTDTTYTTPYDFSIPVSGDVAIFAKLAPDTRTVTFVTNGGSSIDPVTDYRSYEYIDWSLYVPTREGYVFTGWYTDDTLTTPVGAYNFGEDLIVYAKYDQVIDVPVAETFTYTGSEITALASDGTYTVTGNTAIDAGSYVATVTPVEGYCWADGTRDPKSVAWTIAPAGSDSVTVEFVVSDITTDVLEPGITVEGLNDEILVMYTDYTVMYVFDPSDGFGDATITLNGNYSGIMEVEFAEPTYTVTSGAASTWQKDSSTGMTITANGNLGRFREVAVDGTVVPTDKYNASSGSTVITFMPSYLNTLADGSHNVEIRYADGIAASTFTIAAAPTPTPTNVPTATPTAIPTATPTPIPPTATPTSAPNSNGATPAPAAAIAADNLTLLDYNDYIPDSVEVEMRNTAAFLINRGDTGFTVINNGRSYFTGNEIRNSAFENFTNLDSLGRTGPALACIDRSLMPASGATVGDLSSITPAGFVPNTPLTRIQSINFVLTGETTNARNIFTGSTELGNNIYANSVTPVLNILNGYAGIHVMYRVTPVYIANDLVPKGVIVEAYSVEDNGALINTAIYYPNVSNTYNINYNSGDALPKNQNSNTNNNSNNNSSGSNNNSNRNGGNNSSNSSSSNTNWQNVVMTYYINDSSKVFHRGDCVYVPTAMSGSWRRDTTHTYNELIAMGYTPCEHEDWTTSGSSSGTSSTSGSNQYQTGITRYASYYVVAAVGLLLVAGTTMTVLILKKRKESTNE